MVPIFHQYLNFRHFVERDHHNWLPIYYTEKENLWGTDKFLFALLTWTLHVQIICQQYLWSYVYIWQTEKQCIYFYD